MAQAIIVLKPAHFFSLDNDIIDLHAKHIGAIGVAVYTVLARHLNRKAGTAHPAIGTIATKLGLARSTVKVYLHRLAKAGLIAISPRWDEAGDPTSHTYTLLSVASPGGDAGGTPSGGGGLSADLPPGRQTTQGRSSADPEPSESPKPKNMNQADPESAIAENAEDMSPTDNPASPGTPALPSPAPAMPRPAPAFRAAPVLPPSRSVPAQPCLPPLGGVHDLDQLLQQIPPATRATLELAAHASLLAEGVNPFYLIRPIVEERLITLWEAQPSPHAAGDANGVDTQGDQATTAAHCAA